jgi:hypothetical protein
MPGIVGLVQSGGTDVAETVAASASKLQHLDTLTMLSGTFDGVGLAQVWRDQARPDRDWVDENDFAPSRGDSPPATLLKPIAQPVPFRRTATTVPLPSLWSTGYDAG